MQTQLTDSFAYEISDAEMILVVGGAKPETDEPETATPDKR